MQTLMDKRITNLINHGLQTTLTGSLFGLEKESLRVSAEGKIAQTPHPKVLGSALTHPFITTDYSEALLELITPPCHAIGDSLHFLQQTQAFVQQHLHDEILWANSMPCIVTGEASIPIAEYGTSNLGTMKTVYRRGLGHRYGRMMQVIAGVHFNFSLSEAFWNGYQDNEADRQPKQDFISARYLAMIRNMQRYGWLIPYLFGASPTVCKSFIDGVAAGLEEFDEFTFYQPFATSLRLGDIGYQNSKEHEAGIQVCYDTLDEYIRSLTYAITTPFPEYEKIGVKVDNLYQQLNPNLLQIENEYYNTVRPKQLVGREEKPSLALKKRGIRYIELRSLDLNVFEPLGVTDCQLHFLEGFMLFCLLQDSPFIDQQERRAINSNQLKTAHRGREPGLTLQRGNQAITLKDWANDLFECMQGSFTILDEAHKSDIYKKAYDTYHTLIQDPDLTPSAKIIAEMRENGEAFFPFSMRYSQQHADYFRSIALDSEQETFFLQHANDSLAEQQQLETGDTLTFDQFLERYFSQGKESSVTLK